MDFEASFQPRASAGLALCAVICISALPSVLTVLGTQRGFTMVARSLQCTAQALRGGAWCICARGRHDRRSHLLPPQSTAQAFAHCLRVRDCSVQAPGTGFGINAPMSRTGSRNGGWLGLNECGPGASTQRIHCGFWPGTGKRLTCVRTRAGLGGPSARFQALGPPAQEGGRGRALVILDQAHENWGSASRLVVQGTQPRRGADRHGFPSKDFLALTPSSSGAL